MAEKTERKPRPKSEKPKPASSPNPLAKPKNSDKNRKRIGRGNGSGFGKTAGRGQKGQKSRSGGNVKAGFEGGQLPIYRRLPKVGFTNIHAKHFVPINLYYLEKAGLTGDVTPQILVEKGLIPSERSLYKILGQGEVSGALKVIADKVSASAKEKIEKAGGSVELRGPVKKAKKEKKTDA